MRIGVLVMITAVLLGGCGPAVQSNIPPQEWDGIVFEIQSRPPVIEAGMIEFLVLATTESGRPVHDMVISLRIADADPWRQAIQDGHSGVYRRALNVPATAESLSVDVRRKRTEEGAKLTFPLELGAP